jgi:F420-dependent oxidoreductase-like protein
MEFCLFVEPQMGMTYEQQLKAALAAEVGGFMGFFRSDHFLTMGGDGLPGPTDSWVTLGALARETTRVRLGTLMTSATFRLPGLLAVQVAQLDQMSGGRVELGLGAGWFEAEHDALGIPFAPVKERMDRLEEQLQILTRLWSVDGPFDFAGRHYRMKENPGLPRPVQRPRPPILIGGLGARRTPALAARYADEFNLFAPGFEQFDKRVEAARAQCDTIGRDRTSLRLSVVQTVCCGTDEAEVERRARRIGRDVRDLVENNAGGTPTQVVERLEKWRDRGVGRVYLQLLDIDDLDQVALLAEQVLPRLTAD